MGRDQFFGTRPRPRNSLQDREIVDAIFFTRRDRDCCSFYVRDETEMRLDSKFQARPRRDQESVFLYETETRTVF